MDKKLSALDPAGAASDTDLYYAVQSGSPRKQTLAQLKTAVGTSAPNTVAFAALSGAADRLPYFTGAGALSLAVLTAFSRSLLESVDAPAFRTLLSVQPTASPVFTGLTKNEQLSIEGVAGSLVRTLNLRTSALNRFTLGLDINLETGANAGSDLLLLKYNDAGAYNGRVLSFIRSTGNASIGNAAPNATDQLLVNGPMSSQQFKPGQYLLSTFPSAAAFSGYEIDVTDATGGSKRCRSNGSVWQILNTTTTVS